MSAGVLRKDITVELNGSLRLYREDELELFLDGELHFDDSRAREGHAQTGDIRRAGSPSVCPQSVEGLQRHVLGFVLRLTNQEFTPLLTCSVKGSVAVEGLCCIPTLLFEKTNNFINVKTIFSLQVTQKQATG